MPTVPTNLLAGLLDDAAVFPPGSLALPEALAAYAEHRDGPYRELVGRFLCPASRLGELWPHLGPADRLLDLGLVLDTGTEGICPAVTAVAEDRRVHLRSVEIALPAGEDPAPAARTALRALTRLPAGTEAFVELPRTHGWRDALSLVVARGRGVKLRTGGLSAEAFPSERAVGDFVRACVAEGAAFKCTAGLHHAVRHRDERTGFEHHGFLNLLVALCEAVGGARVDDLAAVLAERDPVTVVDWLEAVNVATAERARELFRGFGSCSFTEPVNDLTGLGLLAKIEA